MKSMKKWAYLFLFGLLVLVSACGTTGRHAARKTAAVSEKDPLTYEQRRKYDYYFLEALRMKHKGDYDAAFELYKHCLDIYPQSAAARYEIAQFYLFLGQEEKSEEALKQAVKADESNFWYKQTLASYYERKREWEKAITVYEDMTRQYPSRLEPLMSLVDLYGQTKDYEAQIRVLNRLEELDGKS